MRVLVYDPFVPAADLHAAGAEPSELDALLPHVDFLTLHCPDTPENYGLLSAARIRALKRGAFFLNLARAALVDDDALYAALSDGHIAGAAFDVFKDEPVRPENRFVQLPNVLVSPHLGGATRDVLRHQTDLIVDGIEAWLRGARPRHCANPSVLER
jgi:D-3-phosphoglycerate dehydrogenase